MKKFSLITMSAILAFGLTACGGGTKEAAGGSGGSGGSSSAGGAVKIGVILPLTGDAAPLGDQSKKKP